MTVMNAGAPLLRLLLRRRVRRGKEDAARLGERMGIAGLPRPPGQLIWIHAASVGEAQSILALVDALLALTTARVLVTTGTLTSSEMMTRRLPDRAMHQFYPLDHPAWVGAFLDHWQPNLVLWTESELWPCMLTAIARRHIPAVLINARLSLKSFSRWKRVPADARRLLDCFNLILAQTEDDAIRFRALKALHVTATGNLKYSASPLPGDERAAQTLKKNLAGRPLWLYASTHDGEEELAARLHIRLRRTFPTLLTIIVPRHPDRGPAIHNLCTTMGLANRLRGVAHDLPQEDDAIYIADTLGELGLFYRLAPLACIGRSFSRDGGGGHNPLEAAQLGCAVLHGPLIGNLDAIYADMDRAGAALALKDEADFGAQLERLLGDDTALAALRLAGRRYAEEKSRVLEIVMAELLPWLTEAGLTGVPARVDIA